MISTFHRRAFEKNLSTIEWNKNINSLGKKRDAISNNAQSQKLKSEEC